MQWFEPTQTGSVRFGSKRFLYLKMPELQLTVRFFVVWSSQVTVFLWLPQPDLQTLGGAPNYPWTSAVLLYKNHQLPPLTSGQMLHHRRVLVLFLITNGIHGNFDLAGTKMDAIQVGPRLLPSNQNLCLSFTGDILISIYLSNPTIKVLFRQLKAENLESQNQTQSYSRLLYY